MKKPKRWMIISAAIVVVIIGLSIWSRQKGQAPTYTTVTAASGPLIQTVTETGTVKPIKELALNFLSAGRVKEIKVAVGDKVAAGTELAYLDDNALQTRKVEAMAGLQIAEANLSKLIAGASFETVSVSRSSVNQAQAGVNAAILDLEKIKNSTAENIRQAAKTLADLESSDPSTLTTYEQSVASAATALENARQTGQRNVENTYNSALLTINDRILSARIALDLINTILEDDDAALVLGATDNSLVSRTRDERVVALALADQAENSISKVKTSNDEVGVDKAANDVKNLLSQTYSALYYAYAMLEATITSIDFTQTELNSYKSQISTQSATINSASTALESAIQAFHNAVLSKNTSISSAEESLRQAQSALDTAIISARNALSIANLSAEQQVSSAQSRLDSARKNLALAQAQLSSTLAPARAQDISLAQAQVNQAQANLAGIEQQIKDSVLKAPLEGVVTAVNFNVGEQFSPGLQPMISILADNSFNVEVDIAESNISKIKIGDATEVTLDAFPDDFVLKGFVSFIEPAQTLIQDIVYYRVKIDFVDMTSTMLEIESRGLALKAGMTANITITTDKRDSVLQVPARAIIEREGIKIVRLLVDKDLVEVEVETGLRGDEGMIEVKKGIKEGDQVITFVKNGK